MKYYSESLNQLFETEKACMDAEREHDEKARKKNDIIEERKAEYKQAEEACKKAQQELDFAWEKVKELQSKYYKDRDEILIPAQEKVKDTIAKKLVARDRLNNVIPASASQNIFGKWFSDLENFFG